MNTRLATLLTFGALLSCPPSAQETGETQPRVVDPGGPGKAPSDAVVLFNGNDLSNWTDHEGRVTGCRVEDTAIACTSGAGNLLSVEKFGSAQIHLEFMIPPMPEQTGQLRGNSGVYLQARYEIQILDSYRNETYPKGSLGAVYGQSAPLVNAAKPPGEWQSYDIAFHAARCDADGKIVDKATVTVLLNGVLVQDHFAIEDANGSCGPGPLMLQDHSGFPGAPVTTMRFRNLWLRHLDEHAANKTAP